MISVGDVNIIVVAVVREFVFLEVDTVNGSIVLYVCVIIRWH